MQRRSWMALALCAALIAFLALYYVESQSMPDTLTQADAVGILRHMQDAIAHKNSGAIMDYIAPAPETRLAGLNQDQLHFLLIRAFRNSGALQAECSKIDFVGIRDEATVEFDLTVTNKRGDVVGTDYQGRVTMHLKRVTVPRMLGIFHAQEWRVTGAESTGLDPSTFLDM